MKDMTDQKTDTTISQDVQIGHNYLLAYTWALTNKANGTGNMVKFVADTELIDGEFISKIENEMSKIVEEKIDKEGIKCVLINIVKLPVKVQYKR